MNTRKLVVEVRPGEMRVAVLDGAGTPLEFGIERDHERSLVGATFVGRVRALRSEIGAAFIDIGLEADGFLNLSKRDDDITEGAAVAVRVDRDPVANKGPRLKRLQSGEPEAGPVPRALSATPTLARRLIKQEDKATWEDVLVDDDIVCADLAGCVDPGAIRRVPAGERAFTHADLDDAFEGALSPVQRLPGGARMIFAETPAMTTVDIDAGSHKGGTPGWLARDVNMAAAKALGAALRQRRIGGIIAVDFLKMPAPADRKTVLKALKAAVADDPAEVQVAKFSPFGVVEIQRQKVGASLAEACLDAISRRNAETTALEALEALCHRRGSPAKLCLPPVSAQLLSGPLRSAKSAAEARLGFDIEVEAVSHMVDGTFLIEEPGRNG